LWNCAEKNNWISVLFARSVPPITVDYHSNNWNFIDEKRHASVTDIWNREYRWLAMSPWSDITKRACAVCNTIIIIIEISHWFLSRWTTRRVSTTRANNALASRCSLCDCPPPQLANLSAPVTYHDDYAPLPHRVSPGPLMRACRVYLLYRRQRARAFWCNGFFCSFATAYESSTTA